MLAVPKSFTARWSRFTPQLIVAEALLGACLDSDPAADVLAVPLKEVQRAGWRSAAASAIYTKALRRLASWCADHGHYAHNVAAVQDMAALRDARHPVSLAVERTPPAHAWTIRRAKPANAESVDEPSSWSVVAQHVRPGDAVLIAAPLCLKQGENGAIDACLCDYPEFVRTPQDPVVPLIMPAHIASALRAEIGPEAAEWHPFSRILGIVRHSARGQHIEVLQVELSAPLPVPRRYNLDPEWYEALIDEASSISPVDSESFWARKELKECLASKRYVIYTARKAAECLSDDEANLEAALARNAALASFDSSRGNTRRMGSPYEGRDAFWCALAALLPAWKAQFSLPAETVSVLLMVFDKAYDKEWLALVSDPLLGGTLRYTPEVIATARQRIAGMRTER
jgi:hypothetical protein